MVALLIAAVGANLAAQCISGAKSSGRWRLATQNGVSWLVDPCRQRVFSIGINELAIILSAHGEKSVNGKPVEKSREASAAEGLVETARARAWGFNTVGGFSATDLPMASVPDLGLGWTAHFHWLDPFDPSNDETMIKVARLAAAPYKNGGHRIGYFTDNEVGWWNGALFTFYITKPPTNYSKRKLINLIESYYGRDWRRFTADFAVPPGVLSFADLLRNADAPVRLRPRGTGINVVRLWTGMLARHYYELVHRSLRAADPEALNFGDRLPIYYDPDAIRAEVPYVDALASNYNVDSPDGWIAHYYFDGLRKLTNNKPVLISEWFFAARENRSGNRNNGHLMTVDTQTERAVGAANAARRFAGVPNIVGIHWFQYRDEPTGGRAGDAEDYDFGLVDTHDHPYEELVAALSAANRTLDAIHRAAALAGEAGEITIPQAAIDDRARSLAQWPKDAALIKGLTAPPPEVPFADLFLAWSRRGIHIAMIGMDYYAPDLLAYSGKFPLSEAFRIDFGMDAGAGPRRFAFFVVPPKHFNHNAASAMHIEVCRMEAEGCVPVPGATTTYLGSDQPRLTGQITLPWAVMGLSGPPHGGRTRVQIAATAFYRSRWMSLSGAPPQAAMSDLKSWKPARLTPAPESSASAN